MATSSPPPLSPPASPAAAAWGPYESKRAFLDNVVTTVVVVVCFSLLAFAIYAVGRCCLAARRPAPAETKASQLACRPPLVPEAKQGAAAP
jgi:hypothetical protein